VVSECALLVAIGVVVFAVWFGSFARLQTWENESASAGSQIVLTMVLHRTLVAPAFIFSSAAVVFNCLLHRLWWAACCSVGSVRPNLCFSKWIIVRRAAQFGCLIRQARLTEGAYRN